MKLFPRPCVVQRHLTAPLDWRGHRVGAAAGWLRPRTVAGAAGGWLRAAGGWLRPRTLAGAAGGWLRAAGGWLSVAGGSVLQKLTLVFPPDVEFPAQQISGRKNLRAPSDPTSTAQQLDFALTESPKQHHL